MPFALLPILDRMAALYRQPRNPDRFRAYLAALTTANGKALDLPIGVYNPMAREHVLERLMVMQQLGAETQLQTEIALMNHRDDTPAATIQVAIGLGDDLGGGWTNRYSTDYQNKFRTQALVKRHFCTPVFWVSEPYDQAIMTTRSREAMHRFIYQQTYLKPLTLADHIRQESYVQHQTGNFPAVSPGQVSVARALFDGHSQTDDYAFIFTFLYGDMAAQFFGYQSIGASDNLGFATASHLVSRYV